MKVAIDKTTIGQITDLKEFEYIYIFDDEKIDYLASLNVLCVNYKFIDEVDVNLTDYKIRCLKKAKVTDEDWFVIPEYINNKFAVIIPNYNYEEWIDKCLTSVAEQTYRNFEVIFVDDMSTDNSVENVEKYVDKIPCLKIIKLKQKRFNGGARNEAYLHLSDDVDYVMYLDSDDWYVDEKVLEKINRSLQAKPDVLFIGIKRYANYKLMDCYKPNYANRYEAIKSWSGSCGKVIKKELATRQECLYNEGTLKEDRNQHCRICIYMKDFECMEDCVYVWNQCNRKSVTTIRDKEIWGTSTIRHYADTLQLYLQEKGKDEKIDIYLNDRVKQCKKEMESRWGQTMVEKYVILANSNDDKCEIPRQLVEINGEKIIERIVRLLKENGVEDIIILAKDKRFDGFGVKRYEPINNTYDYKTEKGYFLDMFPTELMNEPICFIWGDVYFSEEAIKTIVETDTEDMMFFCSYNNKDKLYIKEHDEPFAYKIKDTKTFIEHIEKVKKLYDEGKTIRHPIVWELYRNINGQDVNEHKMTKGFVKINDFTCDIDNKNDVDKLRIKMKKPTKKLSIVISYYNTFELTEKLLEVLIPQLIDDVEVILIDDGCNEKRLDKYKNKIEVIHLKENKGAAFASNEGIRLSNGKYIAFVDSDDLVAKDYIKTLIELINERQEDIITFDWQDMNTGFVVRKPRNYASWKAIYNREIIPLFPEGRIYSYDVPFYNELVEKKYSNYYANKILYYYNSNREGSLTQEKAKIVKGEKKNG